MSETESTESNVTDSLSSTEAPTESSSSIETAPAREHSDKPAGYAPVDLSNLPPEVAKPIEDRLSYMYGQIKNNGRTLNDYRNIAKEQAAVIENLTRTTTDVVNHLQDRALHETEASIQAEMQNAWEQGDNKAYMAAQNKMIDLGIQKRMAQQKPQQSQQQPQQQYRSTAEVADAAYQGGEIAEADYRLTESWQNERDERGQLLRPWAYNHSQDPNNPDQNYIEALTEARAVFTNKRFANLSYQQKLAEVDKRMGLQKREAGNTVLGGTLTNSKKMTKSTLSPKQQEIAIKTRYGGPKAKSDAEHIEAFRKQVERVNQRGSQK